MATENDLQAWTGASGRNWNGLCQALAYNWCRTFGDAPVTYPDALAAYYASELESSDVWSAPPGVWIYYDIGAYGHVSETINDGRDGMASAHVLEPWGINAGATSLADYIARTGATPLGWSYTNGANDHPFTVDDAPPPTPDEDEDDEMKAVIIWRNEGSREWSLIGNAIVAPDGTPGCRVTTSQSTANRWARIYGPAVAGLTRDEYVATQNEARALARDYWDKLGDVTG